MRGLPILACVALGCGGEDTGAAPDADSAVTTDDGAAVTSDAVAAETDEPSPIPVVDAAAWVQVAADDDPFSAQRPEDVACDPEGIFLEAGTLEIDTSMCDWPTLEQPLLEPIEAGTTLEVVFWFGNLLSPEPAEGLAELRFGGDTVWQLRVPIPHRGDFIIDRVIADRDFAAGEPVLFHLHNHGANTWNLASVDIVQAGGSE